jgi:hypothetical protein
MPARLVKRCMNGLRRGLGYGRQGERVVVRQDASGINRSRGAHRCTEAWTREVLSGLHTPRFESAIAFFDPDTARQSLCRRAASEGQTKQGLPLTEQEKRLSHYHKTAAEVRADWQKTLRRVGTIDGVEFYEMNRTSPEKLDFAARDKAKVLGWPVSKDLVTRIGDGVTRAVLVRADRTRESTSSLRRVRK